MSSVLRSLEGPTTDPVLLRGRLDMAMRHIASLEADARASLVDMVRATRELDEAKGKSFHALLAERDQLRLDVDRLAKERDEARAAAKGYLQQLSDREDVDDVCSSVAEAIRSLRRLFR